MQLYSHVILLALLGGWHIQTRSSEQEGEQSYEITCHPNIAAGDTNAAHVCCTNQAPNS